MAQFIRHHLLEEDGEDVLILHLNPSLVETSEELGRIPTEGKSLEGEAMEYVKTHVPNFKGKIVKVMLGGFLLTNFYLYQNNEQAEASTVETNTTTHIVIAGESLSVIAKKYGTTIEVLKNSNGLTTDVIKVGQKLSIPTNPIHSFQISHYVVVAGDSLSVIAKKLGTTVEQIKAVNGLGSDTIFVGQSLKIPTAEIVQAPSPVQAEEPKPTTETPTNSLNSYTVGSGDTLYVIAHKFGTDVPTLKQLNQLTTDTIHIGQKLIIPETSQPVFSPTPTEPKVSEIPNSYVVKSGDSLYKIATQFGLTITQLKTFNQLTSDSINVGQTLALKEGVQVETENPTSGSPTQPNVEYKTHTVKSGDTIWDLSVKYGIPQAELLKVNNLTLSSSLKIGQNLTIPVHNIPVKEVAGEGYGELLDWWTEAQYVLPIGKEAKVWDIKTGRFFYIKRTIGANHADCEPARAADAKIIKEIWGGQFSWKTRPILIETGGRKIAASMASMPHGVEYVKDNNFTGHFDIHFLNSTRHVDGKIDPAHQANILIAAGKSKA